jgi:hypothetical protein
MGSIKVWAPFREMGIVKVSLRIQRVWPGEEGSVRDSKPPIKR